MAHNIGKTKTVLLAVGVIAVVAAFVLAFPAPNHHPGADALFVAGAGLVVWAFERR